MNFEGASLHHEKLKEMQSRFEEIGDQKSLSLVRLLLVHNANVVLKFMMQIQV
ncbi:MAG: hypothetical protein K940chlam8_01207 [Chlamydiae bacterium]|nr:hypothetical protein [Chlamydiota bacterium]